MISFIKGLINKRKNASLDSVTKSKTQKPINPMQNEAENHELVIEEFKKLAEETRKNQKAAKSIVDTSPIANVNQHGFDYVINLTNMSCSCGAKFDESLIPNFRDMCCHMTVAITNSKYSHPKLLQPYKKYFGSIEQHALSNTVENMPAIKGKYYFKSKKYKATLFQPDNSSTRDHEFIRIMVRGRNYSLWLPGLVWCCNGDMYSLPIDQELKIMLIEFILNNMQHDMCQIPLELMLKKDETKKNKIVGISSCQGDKFKVTHIIKPNKDELRFNLKIFGWCHVKGTGVVRYIPKEDKLLFAQRCDSSIAKLLTKSLLPWARFVYKRFYKGL
jgi:hypothetical protein